MRLLHYDNKAQYIKYSLFAVLVVIVSVLQNSKGVFPDIFGARAFILIPLCISISMHEREIPSALFGAFIGLMWDICSGNEGFNTFVLMVLSSICSVLISHLMRKNIITAFVLCGGSVVIYEILYVAVNIIFSGAGISSGTFFSFYLPSAIYTLVFVPVMYFIVEWIFTTYRRS